VKVMKDAPGFIVNRITAPESLYFCLIVQNGIAKPEEVDVFIRQQGLPMGPYELMDYVGIDVVFDSLNYYSQELSSDYSKCIVYKQLVEKKMLGKRQVKVSMIGLQVSLICQMLNQQIKYLYWIFLHSRLMKLLS